MNPRTELEKRYPKADLGKLAIYFRHLVACKTVKSLYTHEHHICPVAQFPEFEFDFPENKITLTKEDHAFAHKLLAAAIPELCNLAPWIAAGDPSKAGKIGGKIAAQIHKKNGTGPYSKEHQMRGAKAGGAAAVASGQILSLVTPENCTAGGRAAGKVAVESGQILALASPVLAAKQAVKL